jgi:hypothetical protein
MWFLPSEAGPGSVVLCPVRRWWQLALPLLSLSGDCPMPFLTWIEVYWVNPLKADQVEWHWNLVWDEVNS